MSSAPTVEECLKELREMFPYKSVTVRHVGLQHAGDQRDHFFGEILVGSDFTRFHGPTLSKAMDQVRQWHKEHRPNG